MQIHRGISSLNDHLATAHRQGISIALVPTMGNLHRGHMALVQAARNAADITVVSIFVNPLQFGPDEDFDRYPRTEEQDRQLLSEAGVDHLFLPPVELLYPQGLEQQVRVCLPEQLSGILCGARRPGHFDGVVTVVLKLFNLVRPQLAVFGRKDYQQWLLIRRMAEDLNVPVEILAVDTVREADGLACSSRNSYLSTAERALAPTLYQTLCSSLQQLRDGADDFPAIARLGSETLQAAGLIPQYYECRDADSLATLERHDRCRHILICVCATIGNTSLIDNAAVQLPPAANS